MCTTASPNSKNSDAVIADDGHHLRRELTAGARIDDGLRVRAVAAGQDDQAALHSSTTVRPAWAAVINSPITQFGAGIRRLDRLEVMVLHDVLDLVRQYTGKFGLRVDVREHARRNEDVAVGRSPSIRTRIVYHCETPV